MTSMKNLSPDSTRLCQLDDDEVMICFQGEAASWRQHQDSRSRFLPERSSQISMVVVVVLITAYVLRCWHLRPRRAPRGPTEVEYHGSEGVVGAAGQEIAPRHNNLSGAQEIDATLELMEEGVWREPYAFDIAYELMEEGLWNQPSSTRETERVEEAIEAPPTPEITFAEIFANNTSLNVNDFLVGDILGEGAYGEVRSAYHILTGKECAVKIVSAARLSIPGVGLRIREEIALHTGLRHKNIVQLFGHREDQRGIFLFMELLGGSLSDFKRKKAFTEKKTANCLVQLAEGLMHCHAQGIIHRDVKSDNVLVGESGVIKLADFGNGVRATGLCYVRATTLFSESPEMAEGQGYDEAVDIWALGVVLYELLVGNTPFLANNVEAIYSRIRRVDVQWPPYMEISDGAKDLVSRLLKKDPRQRLPLREVLTHPWIVEHLNQDVAEKLLHG